MTDFTCFSYGKNSTAKSTFREKKIIKFTSVLIAHIYKGDIHMEKVWDTFEVHSVCNKMTLFPKFCHMSLGNKTCQCTGNKAGICQCTGDKAETRPCTGDDATLYTTPYHD